MKKPLFNLFLLLGCILIFVAGLCAVLILAPGVSFFDVSYVRASNSKYEMSYSISEIGKYDNIVIYGKSTPITVEFVQKQNANVKFNQNFSGFTRSGEEGPQLFVTEDKKTLNITVNEYEPFGYGRDYNNDSGLYIELPIYYSGNIDITANKSKISFCGLFGEINNIALTTKGNISFLDKLTFGDVDITAENSDIVIGEKVNIQGNLSVLTKRADLSIENPVGGKLSFLSSYGSLSFAGCAGDATVDTQYGKVSGFDDLCSIGGKAIITAGGNVEITEVANNVNIHTKSGNVTIGKEDIFPVGGSVMVTTTSGDINLLGTYSGDQVSIKTMSGDLKAYHVGTLVVTTKYGHVDVTSVGVAEIVGGSGKIKFGHVGVSITATTKRGNIILSYLEGPSIAEVNLETTSGKVFIYNPSTCNYNIKTKNGDVYFYGNADSPSVLNIETGSGNVVATKISGLTVINTKGKVSMSLMSLNAKVSISGKDKNINIELLSNEEVFFKLSSKKKNIIAPGVTTKTNEFITTTPGDENKTVEVGTRWGNIIIEEVSD